MAQYDVVLQGGKMVALVPAGEKVDPAKTKVFLYDTEQKLWKSKRHIQSVIAHGNGWTVPEQPERMTIDQLIPTRVLRMR